LTLRPHTTLSAREQGVPGLALDGLHEVLAQLDGVHIEGDVGVGATGEIVGQAPGVAPRNPRAGRRGRRAGVPRREEWPALLNDESELTSRRRKSPPQSGTRRHACGAPPLRGYALEQPDQSEVAERVRELGSPARLEVGQQVEPAGVVGAVATPAQRSYAVG